MINYEMSSDGAGTVPGILEVPGAFWVLDNVLFLDWLVV